MFYTYHLLKEIAITHTVSPRSALKVGYIINTHLFIISPFEKKVYCVNMEGQIIFFFYIYNLKAVYHYSILLESCLNDSRN